MTIEIFLTFSFLEYKHRKLEYRLCLHFILIFSDFMLERREKTPAMLLQRCAVLSLSPQVPSGGPGVQRGCR